LGEPGQFFAVHVPVPRLDLGDGRAVHVQLLGRLALAQSGQLPRLPEAPRDELLDVGWSAHTVHPFGAYFSMNFRAMSRTDSFLPRSTKMLRTRTPFRSGQPSSAA